MFLMVIKNDFMLQVVLLVVFELLALISSTQC